jgi:hypothetical protein
MKENILRTLTSPGGFGRLCATAFLTVVLATQTVGQNVTTPLQALGFNLGDDYQLATYTQLQSYWATLARESDRMVLEEIGRTEEGRPHLMAIITSPENHRNLDRYREISRRLALAEDLTDEQARELARQGKAVVWIDGGLHATEVLGAHQLMELVYQMVSRSDEETMRFLNDAIILAAHANPDGMELVSNWYMREPDPMQRSTSGIPVLYQKYTGHDNNRDFYMSTQSETINMNRILYREWNPQIVYNHHQTGPAGTVMFAPPFRDPFNYNYHSLMPLSIEAVGTAMHSRFVREGKGGTTMRTGASYSTWWNGGLRTTPYFHNMIGLLTETIGHPTPIQIPLILDRQLPQNDIPLPIEPQQWHFRTSIEYSMTANRAVLNYATRNKEDLLYNIYVMGRDAIAKGNRDTWRTDPSVIAAARNAAREMANPQQQGGGSGFGGNRIPTEVFTEVFRDPELRDPRGYIIPADQVDFPTATKFVNTLIKNGTAVHEASRSFTVAGKQYPEGSYVVKTAQAARPFVLDMFEPQVHPNDFAYPGGPPISPYDNTGWTVAFQMGVKFDRILDGFDGPFERIDGFADATGGRITNASGAVGFVASHRVNDVFIATNRLMKDGESVFWLAQPTAVSGESEYGSIYIPVGSSTRQKLERLATELGVEFRGVQTEPDGRALRMRPVRVGLWDQYGGSMPSGWARWILEQFEFDHEVVYPQRLDAGNLRSQFDVLIFVNGAIPDSDRRGGFGGGAPENVPAEYQDRLGSITVSETVPQLEEFLRQGGTMITIGSSTSMADHVEAGLENYLLNYEGLPMSRDEFFVPGSIVRVRVDNTQPVAWGLTDEVDMHFNNSPVFALTDAARANDVTPIGWFDTREPLRSGWAWGQHHLNGGVTVAETPVGEGKLYLFGPEIIRRGQPHGTFKLLFNGIYLSGAEEVNMVNATSN